MPDLHWSNNFDKLGGKDGLLIPCRGKVTSAAQELIPEEGIFTCNNSPKKITIPRPEVSSTRSITRAPISILF